MYEERAEEAGIWYRSRIVFLELDLYGAKKFAAGRSSLPRVKGRFEAVLRIPLFFLLLVTRLSGSEPGGAVLS
jgi:hypothetical protein